MTNKDNPQSASGQPAKRKKPEHQLWLSSCDKASDALEELIALQQEYQNEYDDMTERRQESAKGERLSAICDLHLEDALDIINEAAGLELP